MPNVLDDFFAASAKPKSSKSKSSKKKSINTSHSKKADLPTTTTSVEQTNHWVDSDSGDSDLDSIGAIGGLKDLSEAIKDSNISENNQDASDSDKVAFTGWKALNGNKKPKKIADTEKTSFAEMAQKPKENKPSRYVPPSLRNSMASGIQRNVGQNNIPLSKSLHDERSFPSLQVEEKPQTPTTSIDLKKPKSRISKVGSKIQAIKEPEKENLVQKSEEHPKDEASESNQVSKVEEAPQAKDKAETKPAPLEDRFAKLRLLKKKKKKKPTEAQPAAN